MSHATAAPGPAARTERPRAAARGRARDPAGARPARAGRRAGRHGRARHRQDHPARRAARPRPDAAASSWWASPGWRSSGTSRSRPCSGSCSRSRASCPASPDRSGTPCGEPSATRRPRARRPPSSRSGWPCSSSSSRRPRAARRPRRRRRAVARPADDRGAGVPRAGGCPPSRPSCCSPRATSAVPDALLDLPALRLGPLDPDVARDVVGGAAPTLAGAAVEQVLQRRGRQPARPARARAARLRGRRGRRRPRHPAHRTARARLRHRVDRPAGPDPHPAAGHGRGRRWCPRAGAGHGRRA